MTEQVAAAAAPAAPVAMSVAQGAQLLAERRASQTQTVDKSEAARTLGKAGAEALAKRRAEAKATPDEQQTTTDEPEAEALQADGTQDGATDTQAQPAQVEAEGEGEAQDSEPIALTEGLKIDLGDGLVVTADEVRDGFMLKADHTKKTMALADERKAFESQRNQKLSQLDKIVLALQQSLPQPKTRKQFTDEYGLEEGLDRFDEQNERLARMKAASSVAERERFTLLAEKTVERDKALAETYRKEWADASVRDKEYTEMSAFALSLGATPEQLREAVEPWMIQVLHMALKNSQAEKGRAGIVKTIAEKPKVTKPGAKVTAQAGAQNSYQSAMGDLKKTGSLEAAVNVLRARRALGR